MNLQVIGQENSLELRTANDELMNLRIALEYSRRQAAMYEAECTTTGERITIEKSMRQIKQGVKVIIDSGTPYF